MLLWNKMFLQIWKDYGLLRYYKNKKEYVKFSKHFATQEMFIESTIFQEFFQ